MSNKDVIVEISQPEIIVEVEQVEFVTEAVVGQKGDSAYKQAVEGGYTGTLEEFEAQLNALPELTGEADTDLHKHDQMYYTEDEVDTLLLSKAGTTHTHDDRYYTETETNTLLATKADKLMATNLITNGDFSNGTTGWSASNVNTSIAVVDGALIGTSIIDSNFTFRTVSAIQITSGRKYYISFKAKSNTTKTCGFRHSGFSAFTFNPTSTLVSRSTIVVATSTVNSYVDFYISGAVVGNDLGVDDVVFIDLTATFGAGNEPTATEMDALLTKFTNSWFDGTNYLADLSEITKLGTSVIQNATEANAKVEATSNGTVVSRSSAGGSLLLLSYQGATKAYFNTAGYLWGAGLSNSADSFNALVNVPTTGTEITRNKADANPALKVNQANASSTGNIAEFQWGGSTVSKLTRFGYLEAQGMYNPLGTAYSWVYTPSTGTIISRNLADANTALTVNHINTGSTGKLLDLQFGGVSKAHFDKDGILNGLVAITDAGNYYTSTDVEGALQEIGLKLAGLQEALDQILGA